MIPLMHAKRKLLKCDFEGCNDLAQWYREFKGNLVKLCTKHEAHFSRKRWGRHVDLSELDEDDLRYLEEKDEYRKTKVMAISSPRKIF